jgi:hypothetical protein
MRLAVAAVGAMVLMGCDRYMSPDTTERDARKIPIMAAAMDCEVDELRRLAPSQKDVKGPAGHTALHWHSCAAAAKERWFFSMHVLLQLSHIACH